MKNASQGTDPNFDDYCDDYSDDFADFDEAEEYYCEHGGN